MKLITKDYFSQWEKAHQLISNLEDDIQERIGYVISFWMKAFGGKLTNWYFEGAEENEVGNLIDHMYSDSIHSIHVDCDPEPKPNDRYNMVILIKDGRKWAWDNSIPLRWLFEDCEEEIVQGKSLYETKLKNKKEASALKKSLKKKSNDLLATQAKAKLSKEELDALRKTIV